MPWTSKAVEAARESHAKAALYGRNKPQQCWPWAIERNKELITRFYGPGMWSSRESHYFNTKEEAEEALRNPEQNWRR